MYSSGEGLAWPGAEFLTSRVLVDRECISFSQTNLCSHSLTGAGSLDHIVTLLCINFFTVKCR